MAPKAPGETLACLDQCLEKDLTPEMTISMKPLPQPSTPRVSVTFTTLSLKMSTLETKASKRPSERWTTWGNAMTKGTFAQREKQSASVQWEGSSSYQKSMSTRLSNREMLTVRIQRVALLSIKTQVNLEKKIIQGRTRLSSRIALKFMETESLRFSQKLQLQNYSQRTSISLQRFPFKHLARSLQIWAKMPIS